MKVIYVAGPYRSPTEFGIMQNIQRAERLALEVWKLGVACICPHKNTAGYGGAVTDEVILDGLLEVTTRCDAVLCTEDWEKSVGARGEVELAQQLGIPVFTEIEDLRTWLASK